MTIEYRRGDLFAQKDVNAYAHGCNCTGVMGAGIAAQFRARYPLMYESYRKRCAKPGGFIPGDVMPWHHRDGFVFNLATQPDPGPSAETWMITAAVGRMITEAYHDFGIKAVAMPMIGCGLGGLTPDDLTAALSPYQDAPVHLIVVEYAHPEA